MQVETVVQLLQEKLQSAPTKREVSWEWTLSQLASLLTQYPAGVTEALLLSELEVKLLLNKEDSGKAVSPTTKTSSGSDGADTNLLFPAVEAIRDARNLHSRRYYRDQAVRGTIQSWNEHEETMTLLSGARKDGEDLVKLQVPSQWFSLGLDLLNRPIRITNVMILEMEKNSVKAVPLSPVVAELDLKQAKDQQFLQSKFQLRTLPEVQALTQSRQDLLVKIAHVGKFRDSRALDRGDRVIIYVNDGTLPQNALLLLHDEFAALRYVLREGESIALKNVQVHVMEGGEVQLEMDQDTWVFIIPKKPKMPSSSLSATQSNSIQKPPLSAVVQRTSNPTSIFGQICELQVLSEKEVQIVIVEGAAYASIMVVDNQEVFRFRPGQYILAESFEWQPELEAFLGHSITNVSLLPSFLTSTVFENDITQQSNHKIVDLVVQGCQFSSDTMIAPMHSRCHHILVENGKHCEFCDADISDNGQWEYTIVGIQWTLKDLHSGELYAGVDCSWFALKELLNVSMEDFLRWNVIQRKKLVESCLKKRLRALLMGRDGSEAYRMDSVMHV